MTRPQASRRGGHPLEKQSEITLPERPSGFKSPLIWISIIVAFLIGYMLFSGDRGSRPPGPSGEAAPASPPKIQEIQKEDKSGGEARTIIASIRKKGGKFNLTWVYTKANRFLQEKKLADAYLLYFFAAREGHTPSAFVLGEMADPQYHSPGASLFDEPDPLQALKWYQMASRNGVREAEDHLQKLRQRIEAEARAGDPKAQQLMLGWR